MSDAPRRSGEGERTAAPHGDQSVFSALADAFLALVSVTTAAAGQGGAFGRDADAAWAWAPVDIPDVNRVLLPRLAGSVAEVEAGIEALEARFEGRPHTWWLDPGSTPSDLVDALRWVAAPRREGAVPVMALGLDGFAAAGERPGVVVSLAVSTAEVVAAQRLCAMGFGATAAEAEPFGQLFGATSAPAGGPLVIAVASVDGEAAATALAIVTGEVAGIYNVATLPDARRRGLGRAVMDAVLVEARARGARRAVLESSDEGHPLYRAMGFRDAGEALVMTVVPAST